jgi:bacterioferritin (cytochrome b1)
MTEQKTDPMEVDEVVDGLNAALPLQFRSAMAYTVVGGSLTGVAFHGLAGDFRRYAHEELDSARHLTEKVVTLGGEPVVQAAPVEYHDDPHAALGWLIEVETECIEALHAVIPHTGQEGRSEALEHRLEHVIMRKQEQVDALIRAAGAT